MSGSVHALFVRFQSEQRNLQQQQGDVSRFTTQLNEARVRLAMAQKSTARREAELARAVCDSGKTWVCGGRALSPRWNNPWLRRLLGDQIVIREVEVES